MPRHRPPATAWAVCPARWHMFAIGVVATGAALTVWLYWMVQGFGIETAVVLGALCCSFFIAWKAVRNVTQGSLRWDGDGWHFSGVDDTFPLQIQCVLDLNRRMLLQGKNETGVTLWMWLESPTLSPQWLSIRRAIVSTKDRTLAGNAKLLR